MKADEIVIRVFGFAAGLCAGVWALSQWSPVFGGSIKSVMLILFGM